MTFCRRPCQKPVASDLSAFSCGASACNSIPGSPLVSTVSAFLTKCFHLLILAANGHHKVAEYLLKQGATVNATDKVGRFAALQTLRVGVETRQFSFWCSRDRKSVVSGKSVSVRVDFGGRRANQTKTKNKT